MVSTAAYERGMRVYASEAVRTSYEGARASMRVIINENSKMV